MINWNEVTVGETEIEKHDYPKRTILAIDGGWVWAKDYSGHMTIHKNELIGWTIYDPWEEITKECKFSRAKISDYSIFEIRYQGKIVRSEDSQFKVGPDLRVWMRKEG